MKQLQLLAIAGLLMASAGAIAEARYGDWKVEVTDDDTVIASTVNDSGLWLGKICWVSTQKCVWALSVADTCKDGDSYVGLVNANSGARDMRFLCSGRAKDGQTLVIQEYDSMNEFSANDPMIGIAMPMQNGTFKVLRFSLSGSHEATQAAEAVVTAAGKDSTRELTL